ncbi:hypothetical protein EW145_g5848 [Phellinidium pouzarii]|uniref:Glycoside hydrolase family 71 protein n=1 Tax=Phellinidium pouzarii TaxID=167371 RepID=A0A4S4L3C1_9AGAM|nr:hypothetical protein EW145_g5848 [Phellinidium pouzarii]
MHFSYIFHRLLVLLLPLLSATVTSTPLEKRGSGQKYVFAHHIVGNTFSYTVDNWLDDIKLANANGIDAFALNIGSDSWEPNQVKKAYAAAEQSKTTFKLFISFDMTALPCATARNAASLRNYITTYAKHPSQFKYNGKVFASTFSGEKCTFGQRSVSQGWVSQFTGQLTGSNSVFFVPSFFVDPNNFRTYASAMDGQLNWNSAWPITVTTNSLSSTLKASGATAGRALTRQGSPLVTEVGEFIYLSDQLYPSRWQSIIEARDHIPMVEVLTWNDYGESHYVGPIKGSQPNSQAWVDGFDHSAWLDLTKYFSLAYKNGKYPVVANDNIYMWARPHAKNAIASSDPIGKPNNFGVSEDALFVVVLTSAPANATLSTSSVSHTVAVPAGLTQLSLPLNAGDSIYASISRGNTIIVKLAPRNFRFEANPKTYNFNAFTAMASSNSR